MIAGTSKPTTDGLSSGDVVINYVLGDYIVGPEPEDKILVNSGILDRLLAQAMTEIAIQDWEMELVAL